MGSKHSSLPRVLEQLRHVSGLELSFKPDAIGFHGARTNAKFGRTLKIIAALPEEHDDDRGAECQLGSKQLQAVDRIADERINELGIVHRART